jgi:hypothetical protein
MADPDRVSHVHKITRVFNQSLFDLQNVHFASSQSSESPKLSAVGCIHISRSERRLTTRYLGQLHSI